MTDDKNPLKLFIGTSGWSYLHWSGVFYPHSLKPDKYLEHYVTFFNCVELNSSFYHLPKSATINGWIQRTPDGFRFCPKLSRYITHQLKLQNAEEPLNRFFNVFDNIRCKLGPILIQLPPALPFDKSLITSFLKLLRKSYKYAVEVRHKSWITHDFIDLLAQNNIAFVIAESGKRFPNNEIITTDFVYLRFHGRESLYASDYDEHDLKQYAQKIVGWLACGKEVWAFFNNDFQGYAVKNALRLKEMVESA